MNYTQACETCGFNLNLFTNFLLQYEHIASKKMINSDDENEAMKKGAPEIIFEEELDDVRIPTYD